jgi:hypothetical protein
MLSLGSGFQIQVNGVPTGGLDATNWYRHAAGWKRIFNEIMDTWGSLYEFAAYGIRGALPEAPPNQSQVVVFLRKMLLFDVDPP